MYIIPHLTDSSDPVSLHASHSGYDAALSTHGPSPALYRTLDAIVDRDYGPHATPAQGIFLLAAMARPKPMPTDAAIAAALGSRVQQGALTGTPHPRTSGFCSEHDDLPDHLGTKEINLLIRVLDGKIKDAPAKLTYIMGLSPEQLRNCVAGVIAAKKLVTSNGRVNMPAAGIQGLRGFLAVSELLPPARKAAPAPTPKPFWEE